MTAAGKLTAYRAKRDFARTAEPSGEAAAPALGRTFVIQKHAARRLHYDFRLELDGVLLSWSVPKGPSLNPADRRLAVRVEDHPLDYRDFEGVIPAGQYGGGAVVVWDRGRWQPEGDPHAALARGRLSFSLEGEKLHGRWHLVRTKPQGKQESWLLFKSKDDAAIASAAHNIVDEQPASVLSGQTIEQVAAAPARVWNSNRADPPSAPPAGSPAKLGELVAQLPGGGSLTNLDKILYAGDPPITKLQVIAYLAVVAERMLPHVVGRPLTLVRCPNGEGHACFFQKHATAHMPAAIERLAIPGTGASDEPYMVIRDLAGLVALAQLGALEIHTWGCHARDLEHPDVVVIDIDPGPAVGWDRVALAALEVRRRLHDFALASFVKTTGGKGLHVVVPVTVHGGAGWDDAKAFARSLAQAMATAEPRAYTANMAKAQRRDRIYIDYLRNTRGATFIAPYSLRARPGAPIAMPITWEQLAAGVDPRAYTIATLPAHLREPDAWSDFAKIEQTLPRAAGRLR